VAVEAQAMRVVEPVLQQVTCPSGAAVLQCEQ